jgi:membrane protein required for colicin V production
MNWLDVLLGLLLVVGLFGGYFQGLIRQALSLGAVVCAIILGTYLQVPLAAFLAFTFPEASTATTDTAAFLVAVLVLATVLELAQRKAVPVTRLVAIGLLDRIAGLFIAMVTVCLQMSIALLALNFIVAQPWPIGETFRLLISRGMKSSFLAVALYNLLVVLVTVVGRLLPEGKPKFLTLI